MSRKKNLRSGLSSKYFLKLVLGKSVKCIVKKIKIKIKNNSNNAEGRTVKRKIPYSLLTRFLSHRQLK